MNYFKRITNERWQTALDKIKVTKLERQEEETVNEIRENIKFILGDNQNGELKDQTQLKYLQKHLNSLQLFQSLWEYKKEQIRNRKERNLLNNQINERQDSNKKKNKKNRSLSSNSANLKLDNIIQEQENDRTKQKEERDGDKNTSEMEKEVEKELLEAQRKLLSNLKLRRYERNSSIYKDGDKNAQYFYIIWHGEAEEILSSDVLSNELSEKLRIPKKKRIREGEFFGEKELIIRGQRQATVRCIEETYVLYLNQQIFYSQISAYLKAINPILCSQDDGVQKNIISTFLDREDQLQLAYIQQSQTLIYGNSIYSEGDLADCFYTLAFGQVTFSKYVLNKIDHLENSRITPPKRRKQLSFITAPECFGEENLQIQLNQMHINNQEQEEEGDNENGTTELRNPFLSQLSFRELTASVASDKAIVHRIPYQNFLERMYKRFNYIQTHDLLNNYLAKKVLWRSQNEQKIEKVYSAGRYHQFLEGKSTNLLACKTGEPLEKYSLERLHEQISSKQNKTEQKRSATAVKSRGGGGRLLRKMSTVNSIVLTEDSGNINPNNPNNKENYSQQQQNLVSYQSFSKFLDLPSNQNINGIGSFVFQRTNNPSPEKRMNQLIAQQLNELESDSQYQKSHSMLSNIKIINSKQGGQQQSGVQSHKKSKYTNKLTHKESDINFLDFIEMKEQNELKRTQGNTQLMTPSSIHINQKQIFDQNTSFIQVNKYTPQIKQQYDNNQMKSENSLLKKQQNNDLTIQTNQDEKTIKQNFNHLNISRNTPQYNTNNNTNKNKNQKTPQQQPRDASSDIKYKLENRRRFTSLSQNNNMNNNHPLIKIIQDSQDKMQPQEQEWNQDLRKTSYSPFMRGQANRQGTSQSPRDVSSSKNENVQQRLVTDLDEYYKQNVYLESLIEERKSNLINDSSKFEEKLSSPNIDQNDKLGNSLIKRKQYSAMLQSQQGQQKIVLSISNQRQQIFDLDDKSTSKNILNFKQQAIHKVTKQKLPIKLDVSGICQQTHRFDHLIRKLEKKKQGLQEMKESDFGDKKNRIPSSSSQYKKSQNIILNMVDNYFKNVNNNSGYPQAPSIKQYIQNNNNNNITPRMMMNATNGFSQTQYSKMSRETSKPASEFSKNTFINYFRSPMKTAQSYRSRSNPKSQMTTLNNGHGAKHLSVTNPLVKHNHTTELNQTFSTFMLNNSQLSPI